MCFKSVLARRDNKGNNLLLSPLGFRNDMKVILVKKVYLLGFSQESNVSAEKRICAESVNLYYTDLPDVVRLY